MSYSYNAYVTSWGNRGLDMHVIANGKTSKGMLSQLRLYVSKIGKHSPYNYNTVVFLWCIDSGVYERNKLGDYK